jgi:SAM-dependent methyltransferase
MYTDAEIERFRAEAIKADRRYNEALTALDGALPRLPEMPHPPIVYDESQLPVINERWRILAEDPAAGLRGWRRRLAIFLWRLVGPTFARQQTFNSALVDHLNRNVEVHRANRAAIEGALWVMRRELEKLEAFHSRLIRYAQAITYFIDTKVQGEHIAKLSNMTETALNALADEFRSHWEAMVAREYRYVSAVDELRTSLALAQKTGLALKGEIGRLQLSSREPHAPGEAASGTPPPPAAAAPASAGAGMMDAYKYVGFQDKFRGSEDDVRTKLRHYVEVFEGADNVLDLGCGRGEFLALLRERGIRSHGLDSNRGMVETCLAGGLDVREGDALAYLRSIPDTSLGGLIAVQVVEHFQPEYLAQCLDTAHQKLRPGSKLVLETVNPACWYAFFEAYIRDFTHAWPLHPDTLKFLVVASGFQRVEVRWLSPYPADASLQPIHLSKDVRSAGLASVAQTFNENIAKLNAAMFSYLDYAVIGERL